jgi:hypothetical protein
MLAPKIMVLHIGPKIQSEFSEKTLNSFDEILVVYGDSINDGGRKIMICALGAQIKQNVCGK